MFLSGEKLESGHYTVVRELGQGGMGVVYLCHDELLQRDVAIKMLLPELTHPSVIVMDNAKFHNKEQISAILENTPHVMLPLPRYSPDFSPIEQSFAILKKRRQFADNKNIDTLFMGNYYVK